MILYYLFATIALTLLFRWVPAYLEQRNSVITEGDSMGHLMYVKEYYRTNGKPIDMSWLYILDSTDYPNGFHKLFYHLKISVSWLEKYGGYLPTIFDIA